MRIFGFDITRVPKNDGSSLLWNRSTYHENGRQISQMTPDELRRELTWVRRELDYTGGYLALYIDRNDKYQRIRTTFH